MSEKKVVELSKRSIRRNRKKKTLKPEMKKEIIEEKKECFLDKNYKKLMIIPLIILFLALFQIVFQTVATGDFIHKGISLAGGTSIFIEKDWDDFQVRELLIDNYPEQDISVREITSMGRQTGILIETTATSEEARDSTLNLLRQEIGELEEGEYTIEFINPTLGGDFFRQTFTALFIAFVLMGIVVFIYFKSFAPSIAVILSAFSDIVITVAIVNVFGIKLSTAGIAGFLMLIGYSVDTDILLSTKMLKNKGPMMERFMTAFKTGGTMAMTTIVTVFVALLFTESVIISQIMFIVLVGLIIDLMNTWILNAGIIRWYIERKEATEK